MSDPALDIFPDKYVPHTEAAAYYRKWVRANPVEAGRWAAFRDDVIANKQVTPPAMSTEYGKGLIAAGEEHMSITRLVAQITQQPPPPDPGPGPPPPPGGGPSGTHWMADFRSGAQDFSNFATHDANLGEFVNDPTHGNTQGVTVVPKPADGITAYPFSNYMCRVVVSQGYTSSSSTGRITFLWQPGEYANSWMQEGQETWFRLLVLFPSGTNPNYPGFIQLSPGDGVSSPFHIFQEWHKNDGTGMPGSTSTKTEMAQQAMIHKTLGGQLGSASLLWWYETNQVQDETNGVGGQSSGPIGGTPIPMQFNHWYDILTRLKLSPNPAIGEVEWYVDGNLRGLGHRSTMPERSDGFTDGLSYQAGIYRDNAVGGTHGNETIYIGAMVVGPTRASVGA